MAKDVGGIKGSIQIDIKDAQNSIRRIRTEIKNLEAAQKAADKFVPDKAANAYDAVINKIKELKTKIKELKQESAQLKDTLDMSSKGGKKTAEELQAMSDKFKTISSEIDKLKASINELNALKRQLSESGTTDKASFLKYASTEINKAKQSILDFQAKIKQLRTELKNVDNGAFSNTKEKAASASDSISKVNNEISKADISQKQLDNNTNKYKQSIKDVVAQIRKMQEMYKAFVSISGSSDSLELLLNMLKASQAELDKLTDKASNLKAKLNNTSDSALKDKLSKDLEVVNTSITKVTNKLQMFKQMLELVGSSGTDDFKVISDNTLKDIDIAKQKLVELRQAMHSNKSTSTTQDTSSLDTISDKATEASTKIKTLKSEIDALKSKLADISNAKNMLPNIDNTKLTIEACINQINSLLNKNKELQAVNEQLVQTRSAVDKATMLKNQEQIAYNTKQIEYYRNLVDKQQQLAAKTNSSINNYNKDITSISEQIASRKQLLEQLTLESNAKKNASASEEQHSKSIEHTTNAVEKQSAAMRNLLNISVKQADAAAKMAAEKAGNTAYKHEYFNNGATSEVASSAKAYAAEKAYIEQLKVSLNELAQTSKYSAAEIVDAYNKISTSIKLTEADLKNTNMYSKQAAAADKLASSTEANAERIVNANNKIADSIKYATDTQAISALTNSHYTGEGVIGTDNSINDKEQEIKNLQASILRTTESIKYLRNALKLSQSDGINKLTNDIKLQEVEVNRLRQLYSELISERKVLKASGADSTDLSAMSKEIRSTLALLSEAKAKLEALKYVKESINAGAITANESSLNAQLAALDTLKNKLAEAKSALSTFRQELNQATNKGSTSGLSTIASNFSNIVSNITNTGKSVINNLVAPFKQAYNDVIKTSLASSGLGQILSKLNVTNLINSLKSANKEVTRTRNGFKDIARIVSGIVISQTFYKALRSVRELVTGVKELHYLTEELNISFGTMFKNFEAGASFTKELQNFAIQTPFSYEDVAKNARQLLAYGFTAKEVLPVMTKISDASAAMGSSDGFERVTRALGQIRTKGRLMQEELRQLNEAGIRTTDILIDKLGLTQEQLKNIGKLNIPAETAIKAILAGLTEQYGGASKYLAQTASGLANKIHDSLLMIGKEMSSGAFSYVKSVMKELGNSLQKVSIEMQKFGFGGWLNRNFSPETAAMIRNLAANIVLLGRSLKVIFSAFAPINTEVIKFVVNVTNLLLPILNTVNIVIYSIIRAIQECFPAISKLIGGFLGFIIIAKVVLLFKKFIVTLKIFTFLSKVVIPLCQAVGKAIMFIGACCSKSSIAILLTAAAIALVYFAIKGKWATNVINKLSSALNSLFDNAPENYFAPTTEDDKSWEDYSEEIDASTDSMNDLNDATEEAGKTAKKALASFDEVFRLTEPDEGNKPDFGDIDANLPNIGDIGDIGDISSVDLPVDVNLKDDNIGSKVSDFFKKIINFIKEHAEGIGLGAIIGGIIGAALTGSPMGAKIGAALGSIIGAVVQEFWPNIIEAFSTSQGIGLLAGGTIGGIVGAALGGPLGAAIGASLGGTLGTIVGYFWDDIVDRFSASTAIGTVAGTSIGAIVGGIIGGPLGAVIGASLGGVCGVIVSTFWDELVEVFTSSGGIGLTAGATIGAIIGSFIGGPIGTVIGATLGGVAGSIVGTFWNEIEQAFLDLISNSEGAGTIGGALAGLFCGFFLPGGPILGLLLGTVLGNFVGKIVQAIKDYFTENGPLIIEGLIQIGDWIIQGLTLGIFQSIEGLWQAIKNVCSSILNWFKQLFGINSPSTVMQNEVGTFIIEGLCQGMLNKIAWIREKISLIVNSILNWFKELFGIHSPSTETTEIGGYLSDGLGNGIESRRAWVLGIIATFAQSILNAFLNIPGKMLNVGINIAKGIGDGILSGIGYIKDKISSFSTSVINKFKELFGIHSPSAVMRDKIGIYLGQGVAEGIKDGISYVTDASDKMVKAATTGLSIDSAVDTSVRMSDVESSFASIESLLKTTLSNVVSSFFNDLFNGFNNLAVKLSSINIGAVPNVNDMPSAAAYNNSSVNNYYNSTYNTMDSTNNNSAIIEAIRSMAQEMPTPVYVGTLVADDRSIKKLSDKIDIIKSSSKRRKL